MLALYVTSQVRASRAGAARATAELRMLKIDQLAFGGNLPAWPTVIL